jgi:hypothetical protein
LFANITLLKTRFIFYFISHFQISFGEGIDSSYGMIARVIEQRGMNWQTSSEEQGTVTPGQMTKQAVYNYPLFTVNESGRTNGIGLTDAPTYETLTES